MRVIITLVLLFGSFGCAATPHKNLPPPLVTTPVEPIKTKSLEDNINKLDQALKRASSRLDRIDVLIDSIPTDNK